jgi:hypothetical protein
MSKRNIAREYRDKHGMEMPTTKLARIMYNENKLMFKDVEDARKTLLSIEGKNQANAKVTHRVEGARPTNPYNLPPSEETDYTPYKISGVKNLGVICDLHAPYHSVEATSIAIKYLKDQKIDGLLLNGDAIDCHKLSSYVRDPKKRDFKYELDVFKSIFEILQKQLKCPIFYKLGNHEERYENFLYTKASELVGVEEFEFCNILKARARGIEIISDKKIIQANNLNIVHGHEFRGGISAPVNIARGLYTKAKVCALQGHNHQTSEHTEPDMLGNVTTTWSVGCLSELHPAYMPINKWNWGVASVELDTNKKDFIVHNKRISKGRIL